MNTTNVELHLYLVPLDCFPNCLGLGTHLFVKVPDQKRAKWPFRSSSQLPPVTTSLTTQK